MELADKVTRKAVIACINAIATSPNPPNTFLSLVMHVVTSSPDPDQSARDLASNLDRCMEAWRAAQVLPAGVVPS